MTKTILYTSNPDFVPTSIEQVRIFAIENRKLYACYANDDTEVGKLKNYAHVVTTKGNNLYILDVSNGMNDISDYKKCNITGIVSVDYPFGESTDLPRVTKNTSIKGISERIKAMFMPEEATDIRISTDGNICVATNEGYVAIDKDNHLTAYPEEMTLDLPVFIISKPKDQVSVGDVILVNGKYAKVTFIKDNKISGLSYTGTNKSFTPIKDFVLNTSMVRVVVSLAGSIGGEINPMMLMMMSDKKDSLLPLLMMNQNGGTMNMNPMILMALSGDKIDMKEMLMLSALNGNGFGNLFPTENKEEIKKD